MTKEEEFLEKRILELADQSFQGNRFTFTAFLSQGEQDVFYRLLPQLSFVESTLFGGMEDCERQMLRFGSEAALGYAEAFPIVCLEIAPRLDKFAEQLTHRDVLGALMSLGIDRSMLGDILLRDKTAYLFCHVRVADYITDSLDKIRHTNVACRPLEAVPKALRPELREETLIVPSLRSDGIIAKVYHLSRSQSQALFREKKVFLNGRCAENHAGALKEGDVVSVRGFGRFIYREVLHETKKGNLSVRISRYV